jgi:NADPH:quinone reductase-like Zn-dependent oxidoreductase
MNTSTRTIPITKYGSADVLRIDDRAPSKAVGDDEVSVAVKYSGINFADIQMRLGFYPDAPPKPFVPGYEVSGYVEEVGKNVSGLEPGQPVVAGTYFGGYASRVTIPAFQVFPLPSTTDLAEGAALPVNFFTAHLALFEMARLRKGDRVLIECATGGVGTLAIQMARHVGAEVVGLTTSPHKKPYIEALGAVAMTRDEFYADASQDNFDFILNASGGKEVKPQMKRLGLTGRMVCIGLSSGVKDGRRNFFRIAKAALQTPRIGVLKLFDASAGVYGLNALRVLEDDAWVARLTSQLTDIDAMGLKPHIGKIFSADEVGDAHRYLQTKKALGKVLLSW